MSGKCKPEYKNLNLIKSYSDQKYATVQWAEQVCKNEEFLRQQVEKLKYLSPQAIRKRFSPISVDPNCSYGYHINNDEKYVCFDGRRDSEVHIDFTDMSLINTNKSDVVYESWKDNTGNSRKRATVPMLTLTDTKYFGDFKRGDSINSHWYVGYDKSKEYQVRPDWINDHFDSEIPGVCRAQTFEVEYSGLLESVDLSIENNGVADSNWASPLFVQVLKTKQVTVDKTVWDKRTKTSVPTGSTETIYVPVGTPKDALATAKFQPDKLSPGFQNFLFDTPVKVEAGEHYALVFSSPLSHCEHCPRIGGWGRNCAVDKYSEGDAFISVNNGQSWERYGHNDLNVEYKFGQLTPQDFAFQCHVAQYNNVYDTSATFNLYLAPIHCNPMTSVLLTKDDGGDGGSNTDINIIYEASVNGRDWTAFTNGRVNFSPDNKGDYPTTLFVRARLKSNKSQATPYIEWMNLIINTELPKEMYVRTNFHNPKLSPMLGANTWGRVYAPWELTPENSDKVTCECEIIKQSIKTEDFTIITVKELDYYLELRDSNGDLILNKDSITGKDNDNRAKYLIDNPSVIDKLKKHQVYIKPYTYQGNKYLFSFDGGVNQDGEVILTGFQFNNSPAYPILECLIQPRGGECVEAYGEWYDFTVDYDKNILLFNETYIKGDDTTIDFLEHLPVGLLTVSYNPRFITDVSLGEIGDRIDNETGLSEQGLILDYFKESVLITDNELETRRVPLRVVPVDPLREVLLIHGDKEIELYEDVDFTMDYDKRELVFPILNIDGKNSRLTQGDIITIVYTPNIEETGISIGYHVTRTDLSHNIRLKPNYIEHKI
ncbi:MAG: hypothetical protein J6M91_05455 [Methanobrevibacter sp.]|nr:hypothetical protein [Methanobrevibacter sp.]